MQCYHNVDVEKIEAVEETAEEIAPEATVEVATEAVAE
jgi:hypothetical protein